MYVCGVPTWAVVLASNLVEEDGGVMTKGAEFVCAVFPVCVEFVYALCVCVCARARAVCLVLRSNVGEKTFCT